LANGGIHLGLFDQAPQKDSQATDDKLGKLHDYQLSKEQSKEVEKDNTKEVVKESNKTPPP
jgi:hypothetical protein